MSLHIFFVQISELELNLSVLGTECSTLQSDLTTTQEQLATAQEDAKRYSEQASEAQAVYERELVNHGKSMQALCDLREQVCAGGKGRVSNSAL